MAAIVYEIINPSDAYTMVAEDRGVAAAAVLYLGNGQYSLKVVDGPDGAEGVPLFLFWKGDDVLEWFRAQFGAAITDFVDAHLDEMADALGSVLIGRLEDRRTFESGLALIDDPAKRQTWREQWLDARRSSMNNIGGNAAQLAQSFRASALARPA